MTTTPVTLTIRVSAAEAAIAGADICGDIAVQVRPSALSGPARAILSKVLSAGVAHARLRPPVPPTEDSVQAWLEASAAAEAEHEAAAAAQREHAIQTTLTKPLEAWISMGRGYGGPTLNDIPGGPPYVDLDYPGRQDPRVVARREEAKTTLLPGLRAAFDATEAEKIQRREAAEADKKAAAKRRTDQLAAFVAKHPALAKRAARGLLPEEDILGALRDEVFAPLADLPRYERMTVGEVRRSLDADGAAIEFTARDADTAEDADVAMLETIEQRMPGCTAVLREHIGFVMGQSGDDDPDMRRYSVRVTITVGEITMSREYAADRPE